MENIMDSMNKDWKDILNLLDSTEKEGILENSDTGKIHIENQSETIFGVDKTR